MNRRIRILFTISNFNTAGSGKVIYDLVKGLDSSKFEIEIACEDRKGGFFETMNSLGFPIHIFETKTPYRPYYSLIFRIWKIAKFYRKNDYDIIHSWQWSSDWTEALAARMVNKKWIYTKKAMGFGNIHWKLKSYFSHFIITINEEMREYFPNKKAQKLIPLGIDTDYYSSSDFLNQSKDNSAFNIISVANLVPVKGVEVLIKAINNLNDKSIHLTILGNKDNDYGKRLEELCGTLEMDDQVDFLGKKPDVRPYIAKSDLYVIPTLDMGRKEGMPMALVEAMSMQIPLLGSDVTGINFVLKSFPELLFEAGNSDALGSQIKRIKAMSEDERLSIGKSLRSFCINNFTMKKFIDEHENLYTKLIEN